MTAAEETSPRRMSATAAAGGVEACGPSEMDRTRVGIVLRGKPQRFGCITSTATQAA
jgi:hypothetical protein